MKREGKQGIGTKTFDVGYVLRASLIVEVLFQSKWSVQILCAMCSGSIRLGQLARVVPGASKKMVQKLLADRFALKIHEEKREMAAFALIVGKDGPTMTKSADTSESRGFSMGPLGTLRVQGLTMWVFAHALQDKILDRPVVDKTGLDEDLWSDGTGTLGKENLL